MLTIIGPNLPRFSSGNRAAGTAEENAAVVAKSIAMLGTYAIDPTERTLVFRGRADDCVQAFPRNINVSVALELATGSEVQVELWADPAVDRNIHEIGAEGAFGSARLRIENVPSPDNPATSYLAALSILVLLRDLGEPIVVGT
jgi:predicted dinucleotide-utilizing enzyme